MLVFIGKLYLLAGFLFLLSMIFARTMKEKSGINLMLGASNFKDVVKSYAVAIFLWWLCILAFFFVYKNKDSEKKENKNG
ncbi:hypothetical protein [Bacillus cereus group sp. MG11]|uniref:hypothetical protein n=1 Tax=Bacillus cereus group sp. MG11 TaxID=3040248 RepID=UPI0033946FC9